ncbi:cytochrome aa3 quinol oxidase subunit II [Pseudalkalibacillus sp. SCS-8]|uniref:cytochrome aa3 quinol oxidase subunit II n=1 Tax=Pseudalkalibacillus nanhaiensis TaxID=3115291 RepID=UPI0032DBE636
MTTIAFLTGCSELAVLDPKGPVALQQKDLIMWSIGFMLFIVTVVFVLFTLFIVRYRERPENEDYEPPQDEGNKLLEVIWTVVPVLIVIALSVPTVKTIYALEEPPKATSHKDPLVIHATSVDWKWIFTYPEQEIETVNYLHIPEDRPILFKLTSADSMAALWIPRLGGQEYNMAGMETEIYLQADEPGTYKGRNANFTGEGFAEQKFTVTAQTKEEFEQWVEETQASAPKLTKEKYDRLMLKGHTGKHTFSSTHLEWVDHAKQPDYAIKVREKLNPDHDEPF